MEVRIEVDNAKGRLKPGMFADVEIATTVLPDGLLITGSPYRLMAMLRSSSWCLATGDLKNGS